MICKAQVKALISLLVSDDEAFRAQATAEMKRILLGYLAPYFREE